MPDESRKKLLSLWNDRMGTVKKYKNAIIDENKWETYIDEFKGKYDVVLGNQYVPPINEVYAYVESSKATLFQRNPYIAVNAKKTGTILGSYIWEAILNHDWAEMHVKDDVELEIDDTILVGHGWHKVGTNVQTSGSGSQLRLASEKLYSNRVSWRDMFFNIGAKRPSVDALWMAQRIYLPTDDLKEEYGARAAKLKGSPYPALGEKVRKDMLYKDDVNFSAIYEIWDARKRQIYLLADETLGDFLEDPKPWPDYLDEFPFQMLSFNEIPDEAYPMSDIASWNVQILEKIKIFTMILNHVKRGNRQLVMKKGVMTEQEKDKYEKGIDGSILDAKIPMNADIQTAFKFLDYGQMPADYYLILDRIDQVMNKVRGQPDFEQGANTKTQTRTLGELQMIQGGAQGRSGRKLDRIERHCENIARHHMFNRKNSLSLDEVVRITGNEPQEILAALQKEGKFDPVTRTIHYSKEDIQGEYDVGVKAGSTLPLDKTTRDATLKEVLQMAIPLASAPTLPPFISAIMGELVKDYEIKSLDAAFKAQQDAIAQKDQGNAMTQEAEMAKVESETQKRQAQAQQIHTETIIKTANALGKASGDIHHEASILK
jgi:hypothetical protein